MKRGFLNSSKAKATSLSSDRTQSSIETPSERDEGSLQRDRRPISASLRSIPPAAPVGVPYHPLREEDKPHGFTPGSTISRSTVIETDASLLDHDATTMLFTTIPIRDFDLNKHSAKERRDSWTEAILDGPTKRLIFTQPGFPNPILRPTHIAHRIAPCEGKGLGVFATRDIKASELILAERPLTLAPLMLPRVDGIPDHFTTEQVIQAKMAEWEKALEILVSRMLPERKDALMALSNCHEHDGSGPILGRLRTNGIAAMGLHYAGMKGRPGRYTATCEIISRVNHSCCPNARYGFNKPTFSARLRAVRAIKQGEEITITYGGLDIPKAERHRQLAPYGFACDCAACEAGAAADARRAMIPPFISQNLRSGPLQGLLDVVALIERERLEDLPVYPMTLAALANRYIQQGSLLQGQRYLERAQSYLPFSTDEEASDGED
ncbi:SET domain-containing protein [Schizophyllum commune Tattone D]|nr:SET domain-containing protein [Schizophyllum commune Tattone D]